MNNNQHTNKDIYVVATTYQTFVGLLVDMAPRFIKLKDILVYNGIYLNPEYNFTPESKPKIEHTYIIIDNPLIHRFEKNQEVCFNKSNVTFFYKLQSKNTPAVE